MSFPPWAPAYVVSWLDQMRGKLPPRMAQHYLRLVTDARMHEVWDWHSTAWKSDRDAGDPAFSFAHLLERGTTLPGKPGNLAPKARADYFKRVVGHADALLDLLSGTRFDGADDSRLREVDPVDPQSLSTDLASWGVDEPDEGHVVAYLVRPDGVFRLPYDYPDSHLTDLLWELINWTHWDDCWDGSLRSSAPLSQPSRADARSAYYTRTLYSALQRRGIEIPFRVLATVANVVLQLPPGAELDEDTVRKQIRRFERRQSNDNPW